jgi:D-alanyl-D-alanine dipeptidase
MTSMPPRRRLERIIRVMRTFAYRSNLPFPAKVTSPLALVLIVAATACRSAPTPAPTPVPVTTRPAAPAALPGRLSDATQLIVVTTIAWDSIDGTLRRFVRDDPRSAWRIEGGAVPIVVGHTGLAWGSGFERFAATTSKEPIKIEGDGRSPAGIYPIDTSFGFAPADSMRWLRLPYLPIAPTTECVDDTTSVHYNTVVDRETVPRVDWTSAEHMRQIAQYRLGAIIGYNAPPVKARGSCIFFHIWAAPGSPTVGCTALDAGELARLLAWVDPRAKPVVVQLPASVYARVRVAWGLP